MKRLRIIILGSTLLAASAGSAFAQANATGSGNAGANERGMRITETKRESYGRNRVAPTGGDPEAFQGGERIVGSGDVRTRRAMRDSRRDADVDQREFRVNIWPFSRYEAYEEPMEEMGRSRNGRWVESERSMGRNDMGRWIWSHDPARGARSGN